MNEAQHPPGNPHRLRIEAMIREDDRRGLLDLAGMLHGHFCNYLAYGVMAGASAVRELGVQNTGMEEVVALVETNNCFSDGIQLTTGCTFGNNALVYEDLGKTAFSLVRRDGEGVRYVLDPEFEDSREQAYPEAYGLWNRLIVQKEQGSPEDFGRMMQLFHEMTLQEIDLPLETVFRIRKGSFELPPPSMMYPWARCSRCGENVMQPRARLQGEQTLCLACAGEPAFAMDSRGIAPAIRG